MSFGVEPIPGFNYPAGIGYIALPVDIDRSEYVKICLMTSTVSIRTEDGGFINRVPIGQLALNLIEFPEKPEQLGSPVVYVNEPIKNQLMIVDVYSQGESVQDLVEGQFKFKKRFGSSYVEISGSAKSKYIGITVNSESKGEFYVNVMNKNRDAKMRLEVSGDCDVVAYKNTNITSYGKNTLSSKSDKDDNKSSTFTQSSDETEFVTDKFKINKGDQAMVKGDKLKDLLSSFFDDLSSAQIVTPQGNGNFLPDFVTKIQSYKTRLEQILSEKSFLE